MSKDYLALPRCAFHPRPKREDRAFQRIR